MATRNRTILYRRYRDALKSVRVPAGSSPSSSGGGGGPVIELSTSSLLNPNRSYAPLSTEDPGTSRTCACRCAKATATGNYRQYYHAAQQSLTPYPANGDQIHDLASETNCRVNACKVTADKSSVIFLNSTLPKIQIQLWPAGSSIAAAQIVSLTKTNKLKHSIDAPPGRSCKHTTSRGKMTELAKAHAKALMPSFGDGKEDQRRIEALTQEITALLRKSEKRLQRLSAAGPSEDSNIRKNVQRSLATDLQTLSMELRRKQSTYLKRLQQQKEGPDGVDLEMNLNGSNSKRDDDDFDDIGFSEHQMAKLKKSEAFTAERERGNSAGREKSKTRWHGYVCHCARYHVLCHANSLNFEGDSFLNQ
ncbi:hypothetical protein DH2020_003219 [Rehmannia glutinosa]|uniref:Syntaxin N-terminal domain-containing protein n=1 Tax=Rehmannia glutinosa TaxID=99300 RepID=A0ABR0XLF5_REHGL